MSPLISVLGNCDLTQHPHLTNEQTEAQRGKAICPSHLLVWSGCGAQVSVFFSKGWEGQKEKVPNKKDGEKRNEKMEEERKD